MLRVLCVMCCVVCVLCVLCVLCVYARMCVHCCSHRQPEPPAEPAAEAPKEPDTVPIDELILILNPAKTGKTAISVQSYTLEFTWEQLPVIRLRARTCMHACNPHTAVRSRKSAPLHSAAVLACASRIYDK